MQRRHQVRKYHQVHKYPRVHCAHGLCAGEIFACSTDEKKKIVTFLTTLLPKCRARRGAFFLIRARCPADGSGIDSLATDKGKRSGATHAAPLLFRMDDGLTGYCTRPPARRRPYPRGSGKENTPCLPSLFFFSFLPRLEEHGANRYTAAPSFASHLLFCYVMSPMYKIGNRPL